MGSLEEKTEKDQPTAEFKADWRLKSIFAVIGLLNFVVAIDATSVSVALPVCLVIESITLQGVQANTKVNRLSPPTLVAQQLKPFGPEPRFSSLPAFFNLSSP